jgi:hypothetical protein
VQFRPAISRFDWPIALDAVAAVWLVAPPADTPTDPARYAWMAGTPTRDVLLYRNGDAVRGALSGFTDTGVKFTPDGGQTREVELKLLAAVGFNPRFARARKPKEAYAHLVLDDGTRLDVTGPAVKQQALLAKTVCGPELEVPLSRLVSLDVYQGRAVYLSDLKPKKGRPSPTTSAASTRSSRRSSGSTPQPGSAAARQHASSSMARTPTCLRSRHSSRARASTYASTWRARRS